jgi:hypothetical protein
VTTLTTEPKNEEAVCQAVLYIIGLRSGDELHVMDRPDRTERTQPAVERLFESSSTRYAMEHRRVESFDGQIAGGKAFLRLLEPLEEELAGQLPGRFSLVVDIDAATGVRVSAHAGLRQHIREWVLDHAAGLEGEAETGGERRYRTTAQPEGIPFPITLQRRPLTGSEILISRYAPPDVEERRDAVMARALARKLPKLAAQQKLGCVSVLVLESDDIALGNRDAIGRSFGRAVSARDDAPDHVFLVETELQPWNAWTLEDRAEIYPHPRLVHAAPIEVPLTISRSIPGYQRQE